MLRTGVSWLTPTTAKALNVRWIARVEAYSGEEVIEALLIVDASAFALGVQWYPEWKCWNDAVSRRLSAIFGKAVRLHREQCKDTGLRTQKD